MPELAALEEVARGADEQVAVVLRAERVAVTKSIPAGATSNFQLNSGAL